MMQTIELGDVVVEVQKKDIKNVHLSVHPPTGSVRISAPRRMKLETIRVFAVSKLPWIKRQQKKLRGQQRETPREYLERESHFVWGKRLLLQIIERDAPPMVESGHRKLILQVRPHTSRRKRQALVEEWYRAQLKKAVPRLLEKWEPMLDVKVERIFVQRMKTKWGSYSAKLGGVRLNTDLAKKPVEYLEYVLVHEMVHFRERRHDDRFTALMDLHLPQWKNTRQALNSAPLSAYH
jgi:hypothetical protein